MAQSGWSSSSRLIVGTPEKLVTRSRSISSSARPASHLRMNTIAPPTSVHGCSRQLLAVTWNSGVGAMNTGGVGAAVAGGSRRRRQVAGGHRLGLGHLRHAGHEGDVHDVVHRTAVGELGALREAGGARGVEDRDVVVGVDGRRRAAPPARAAGSTTSVQRDASAGRSRSERTAMTCSGAAARSSSSTGSHPLERARRRRSAPWAASRRGRTPSPGSSTTRSCPPRRHRSRRPPSTTRPTRGSCASRRRRGRPGRRRARRGAGGRALGPGRRSRRRCSARPRTPRTVRSPYSAGDLPDRPHRRGRAAEHPHRDAPHLDLGHREGRALGR